MKELKRITCGAYPSTYLNQQNKSEKTFRTYLKRKKRKVIKFISIGTDGDNISTGGALVTSEEFFHDISSKHRLLVGTLRELELLLPYMCQYNISVAVVERDFAIFDDMKFSKSAKTNYKQAESKYKLLKRYGVLEGSLSLNTLPRHRKKFFAKITTRNHLDSYFSIADGSPLRETFVVAEERVGRTVMALDVNSMFLHCMTKKFGLPSSLRRVKNVNELDLTQPPFGLYKVLLNSPKTEFIRNHHPFKWTEDFEDYPFYFSDDVEVEVYISSEEYSFYLKHFKFIKIIECFVFDSLIEHPLLQSGMSLFRKKQKANPGPRKNLLKTELIHLHTVSNGKFFRSVRIAGLKNLEGAITNTFKLTNKSRSHEDIIRLSSKANSKFRVYNVDNEYEFCWRDIHNPGVVSSFGFQIISRSRVYMLEILEKLFAFPGLDICYVNVDGIHFSIPEFKNEDFLNVFSEIISSSELGKFKIEAIAKNGYWFGQGHYYLTSDNELIKYKSGMTTAPGCEKPVQPKRVVKSIKKENQFKFITKVVIKQENTFSYKKQLINTGNFMHQKRLVVSLLDDKEKRALFTCEEIALSKPIKLNLLDKLNDRFVS